MTALADHQSSETTKLLIIGDSGSGKSGSLASLAEAGYNLRIIDMDNGVDILRAVLRRPPYSPGAIARVDFETITDSMRSVSGRLMPAKATAWQRAVGLLTNWPNFGPITKWTSGDCLVVDSLSMLSNAAVNFTQAMNARLGQKMTWDDIYGAQQLLESFAQTLYDEAVKCQVVVLAHPDFIEDQNGVKRGYPATVGNKLSPRIGRYFNNVIEAKTLGSGMGRRRRLLTNGSGVVEVKTSNPGAVKAEYSIEMGLAEFFADVQGESLEKQLLVSQQKKEKA